MLRGVLFLIVGCLFCFHQAAAYEFIRLNNFFDSLENDYVYKTDIKKISLDGLAALTKFDDNLKFYGSGKKVFLYQKNTLIDTFELPLESQNSDFWQDFLSPILKRSVDCSDKISGNEKKLEADLLKTMMQNLDGYSRLETTKKQHRFLNYKLTNGILYLDIDQFYEGSADAIKALISKHQKVSGVILDLRGNRGGELNEAIKTADLFLDGGLIAYSREKGNKFHYYSATAGDIFNGKPTVILTDESTASAAELLAGALSEQGRATIIGTRTYGKGSIQKFYRDDETTLYLTSGQFFMPSGKAVNHQGIMPQICTGIGGSCLLSNRDNPLQDINAAIKLIKKDLG